MNEVDAGLGATLQRLHRLDMGEEEEEEEEEHNCDISRSLLQC